MYHIVDAQADAYVPHSGTNVTLIHCIRYMVHVYYVQHVQCESNAYDFIDEAPRLKLKMTKVHQFKEIF